MVAPRRWTAGTIKAVEPQYEQCYHRCLGVGDERNAGPAVVCYCRMTDFLPLWLGHIVGRSRGGWKMGEMKIMWLLTRGRNGFGR